jgi:HSP20 family molecular chaperone IbpA
MLFSAGYPSLGRYLPLESTDSPKTKDDFAPVRHLDPSSVYTSPSADRSGRLGRPSQVNPPNEFSTAGNGRFSHAGSDSYCHLSSVETPSAFYATHSGIPPEHRPPLEKLARSEAKTKGDFNSDLGDPINRVLSMGTTELLRAPSETKTLSFPLERLTRGEPLPRSCNKTLYQSPSIHREEDRDKVIFELDVPGFNISDLEILLYEDKLTVTGSRKTQWGDTVIFCNQFGVNPDVIDTSPEEEEPSSITADLNSDGILSISLRKKEQSSRCVIPIQNAATTARKCPLQADVPSKVDHATTTTLPVPKKGVLLQTPEGAPMSATSRNKASQTEKKERRLRKILPKSRGNTTSTTWRKGFLLSKRERMAADQARECSSGKKKATSAIKRGFLLSKKKVDDASKNKRHEIPKSHK